MSLETIHVGDGRDLDHVAAALSDPLRRQALRVLRTVETPITLADLARELARREADDPADDPANDPADDPAGGARWEQARRYHIMLHHCHIPKLAAAGLVEYDADEETVAPSDLPESIEAGL